MTTDTPMLRQYKAIKANHTDAILFFRLGDFYEMFFDDAIVASKELDLTLTGRGKDEARIPMCGIPYHAADNYIPRLVDKGFKIAICEQVEDASESKGITKRDVVRVITPGTVQGEGILDEKDNNFLLALYPSGSGFGCSFADITTGEFRCLHLSSLSDCNSLMDRLSVKEIIVPYDTTLEIPEGILVNQRSFLDTGRAEQRLKEHFNVSHLSSFGLQDTEDAYPAAYAVLEYIKDTQKQAVPQLTRLTQLHIQNTLRMDSVTIKNLELTRSIHYKHHQGTLFWALDHTKTAMGARQLKTDIQQPLLSSEAIEARLDAVSALKQDLLSREEIRDVLSQIYDLERLLSRIVSGHHNPRDCIALKNSLKNLAELPPILDHLSSDLIGDMSHFFKQALADNATCKQVITLIDQAIIDDPPVTIRDGYVIKDGYSQDLDTLKQSFKDIKDWVQSLEPAERERTGIKSLKVGFNKVFGYYLEVPKTHSDTVPETYIRKQTLTNAERYITPELKEKENILLHGEDKQIELERQLYVAMIERITPHISALQALSARIGVLDMLQSLATAAQKYNYSRPDIAPPDTKTLLIENGRHPVLERQRDVHVISNSVHMTDSDNRFMLITGPNMAGKSTLMRQVALTVIMAQMGSFVPADRVVLSPVDKLFTRIGALDNLFAGQSTFMVEMVETASILHTATANSLILLDEIGRGTATFDGMSIAWAVTEHLHNTVQARTLFATHYHELTVLEDPLSSLGNFNMKITESESSIVFKYQLIPGPANKSYGVHVAKLAGLPDSVTQRASHLLDAFEKQGHQAPPHVDQTQLALF